MTDRCYAITGPTAMQTVTSEPAGLFDGIRKTTGSEFLHDLRVSVRRARSLLSQMKGVLDARTTAMLQRQFKTLFA